MKLKCNHLMITKIDHWWFRFKCKQCGKRFKWLPTNDYFEMQIKVKDIYKSKI